MVLVTKVVHGYVEFWLVKDQDAAVLSIIEAIEAMSDEVYTAIAWDEPVDFIGWFCEQDGATLFDVKPFREIKVRIPGNKENENAS